MTKVVPMRDSAGFVLAVGDHVQIYFGFNSLRPGVVKEIKNQHAKVLVDAWPTHPDLEYRYSLSKWKRGECMVKVHPIPEQYPREVQALIGEIIRLRDDAIDLDTKKLYHSLLNYWDRNRPCHLVCS